MVNVLVLGGVGFIGRTLVCYLVENDLAEKIRVADKAIPETSYLTEKQKAAFADPRVEFMQANLARDPSIDKAFNLDGGKFDFVFNCAGLSKFGQEEVVYQENVFDLSVKCARKAAEQGVTRFVEVSTARVYAADKKPSSEDGKLGPWTTQAAMKLKAEQELAKIEGLNFVVVRPSIVYGVSDMLGIMPRIICAAVYKHIGEKMKFLWSKDLRLNTVHVEDVARAIWHVRDKGANGEIYNICDSGDSSQGSLNELLSSMFGIETGFLGSVVSNLAKLNMTAVVETSNEKHMQPWSEMCQQGSVAFTPLSPYLDKELLYNNSLSVDGSKIQETGFEYTHPAPTPELLRESVSEYLKLGLFPEGFLL